MVYPASQEDSKPLDQLFQESQRLVNATNYSEIPKPHRNLSELEELSRKLVSKSTIPSDGVDLKGHYLLASQGFDPQKVAKIINSVTCTASYEPFQQLQDTDIEGFLQQQHDNIIISAITEGRQQIQKDFERNFESTLYAEWEATKKKVLDELGQFKGDEARMQHSFYGKIGSDWKGQQAQPMTGSLVGLKPGSSTPEKVGGKSLHLNKKKEEYFKLVQKVNEYRLEKIDVPILKYFYDASRSIEMESGQEPAISECWKVLMTIMNSNKKDPLGQLLLKEGIHCDDYTKSSPKSQPSVDLRKKFIKGALDYLNIQFWDFINDIISSHPREAMLGGNPTIQDKIKAFLRIKYCHFGNWDKKNLEIVDNTPFWAHIFYLLKCGFYREALDFALKYDSFLQKTEPLFTTYFKAYLENDDKRIPAVLRDKLLTDFNHRIRHVNELSDPYKVAVYKIIGRCELSRKGASEVLSSTEDSLWLQFMLIRENVQEEQAHEHYTLKDLQDWIVKIGPDHFTSQQNCPTLYFRVLLLTAQFERAIDYLYSVGNHEVEAVHFAIALSYYGTLRVPLDPFQIYVDNLIPVLVDNCEVLQINFCNLIYQYTREFYRSNPEEALHYLFLYCLHSHISNRYVTLCHEKICELLLHTKEFKKLLGDGSDGFSNDSVGFIRKYIGLIHVEDDANFIERITKPAAIQACNEGDYENSILLFELSKEYDTALETLIKQLGEILSQESVASNQQTPIVSLSMNSDIINKCYATRDKYSQTLHIRPYVDNDKLSTVDLLLLIHSFSKVYEAGNFEEALRLFSEMNFIPPLQNGPVSMQFIDKFLGLHDMVIQAFPNLLCKAMDCVYKLHSNLKLSGRGDGRTMEMLQYYRDQSQAILRFVSAVEFRLPQNIATKLSRMSVTLN